MTAGPSAPDLRVERLLPADPPPPPPPPAQWCCSRDFWDRGGWQFLFFLVVREDPADCMVWGWGWYFGGADCCLATFFFAPPSPAFILCPILLLASLLEHVQHCLCPLRLRVNNTFISKAEGVRSVICSAFTGTLAWVGWSMGLLRGLSDYRVIRVHTVCLPVFGDGPSLDGTPAARQWRC